MIDIHADELIDRDEFEPRRARARNRHADLTAQWESLRSQACEQTALHEALACVDSFSEAVRVNLDQANERQRPVPGTRLLWGAFADVVG